MTVKSDLYSNDDDPPLRCGYVAIAGRPNVGKSTLLNAFVGQHLSIVSPTAQTTRERVAGILTEETFQIIFLDAPGLLEPQYALQEAMRYVAERAISDADIVAFVCNPLRPDTLPDDALLEELERSGKHPLIVINKLDLADAGEVRRLVTHYQEKGYVSQAVSATSGAGLKTLLDTLVPLLPESPPLFPRDETSDRNLRFFAEEFVREACLETFRQEIPHSVICRVEEFREAGDPVFISIFIYVERESQKGIVIGAKGSAIKSVGEAARRKIEDLLQRRIFLELRVKVMPRWTRQESRLRHLGFQLPGRLRKGRRGER